MSVQQQSFLRKDGSIIKSEFRHHFIIKSDELISKWPELFTKKHHYTITTLTEEAVRELLKEYERKPEEWYIGHITKGGYVSYTKKDNPSEKSMYQIHMDELVQFINEYSTEHPEATPKIIRHEVLVKVNTMPDFVGYDRIDKYNYVARVYKKAVSN